MRVRLLAAVTSVAMLGTACAIADAPTADGTGLGSSASPEPATTSEAVELPTSGSTSSPSDGASEDIVRAGVSWTDAPSGSVELAEDVFPLGLSPDGTHLLVQAPDPAGLGCEEGPSYSMQLMDLESRKLKPALDPSLGLNGVQRRGDGTVLLSAQCEGFVSFAYLATETPDGHFVDLAALPLPEGNEGYVDASAIAPAFGSSDILIIRFKSAGGSDIVTLAEDGSVVGGPDGIPGDVYDVVDTEHGVFAAPFDRADTVVTELRSGIELPGYEDVRSLPDGTAVLVTGDAGLAMVTTGAQAGVGVEQWLADPIGDGVVVGQATPTSSGTAFVVLGFGDSDDGTGRLVLAGPDGIVEEIDVAVDGYGSVWLSADENRLVYVAVDASTSARTLIIRNLV